MYKESGGIYKVVWGEHGDMIPKVIDIFSSNFHYCDFGYIDGSNGRWQGVTRSGYGASLYNGVAFSQMEDLGHTKGLVSSTEELCKL